MSRLDGHVSAVTRIAQCVWWSNNYSLVSLHYLVEKRAADSLSLSLSLTCCSVAICRFANGGDDWYVLVGVARDMILNPRSTSGGFIYTYRLAGGGDKLEFVHKVRRSCWIVGPDLVQCGVGLSTNILNSNIYIRIVVKNRISNVKINIRM